VQTVILSDKTTSKRKHKEENTRFTSNLAQLDPVIHLVNNSGNGIKISKSIIYVKKAHANQQ
jgi:hypothetical protein